MSLSGLFPFLSEQESNIFYCSLKVIGILKGTFTGLPLCLPGVILGNFSIILLASAYLLKSLHVEPMWMEEPVATASIVQQLVQLISIISVYSSENH